MESLTLFEKQLQFVEFIYDRQRIWHNRNRLRMPRPWTQDEILHNYKFCNVYRELDRGTEYVIEKIINSGAPLRTKIFNILFYRRFNVPDIFEDLTGGLLVPSEFCYARLEQAFDQAIKSGRKVFSEAYTLCQIHFRADYRKSDKHAQILLQMEELSQRWDSIYDQFLGCKSFEEVTSLFRSIHLIGPFLAYQVAVDCSYLQELRRMNHNDYVVVGPGARGAIEYMDPNIKPRDMSDSCRMLYVMQPALFFKLAKQKHKRWLDVNYKTPYNVGSEFLSLSNIQNSLCEFRKYINLKTNPKARKRYYKEKTN